MVDAFNLSVSRAWPATLTSYSSGVVSPANVLTPQPGERTSTGSSGGVFILDLGSPVLVKQVAVLYHTATAADTFHVIASNDPDPSTSSSKIYEAYPSMLASSQGSSAPIGYRHGLLTIPQGIAARYWWINVVHDISLGRLWLGDMLQPEFNADYESTSWGFEEPADPDRLDSGVTVLQEEVPAPYFEFGLSWLSEAEMESQWGPLSRYAIRGEPVLVCRDPREGFAYRHNGMFYGLLRLKPFVAADFDMFEVTGKIRSMI